MIESAFETLTGEDSEVMLKKSEIIETQLAKGTICSNQWMNQKSNTKNNELQEDQTATRGWNWIFVTLLMLGLLQRAK